jgi:hypothetical protein
MERLERAIADWLEGHSDYQVEGEPRAGTFGQVWVMAATSPYMTPQRSAWKTVNPQKLVDTQGEELVPIFEREMRLWLHLPYHPNVLPALGIDVARLPEWVDPRIQRLPLVRMPYCESNLRTWIGSPLTMEDRLTALCQLANGLQWLYDHGIEGHGDLKPENILVSQRDYYPVDAFDAAPISLSLIRVADLGWANAWIDLGYSTRAWRPYLAPERFDNTFVPIASDVFALGVIAAEILQGKHPAGDSTARIAKWKEDKYRKWAGSSERDLSQVDLPKVRELLNRCLTADPQHRPGADEFIQVLALAIRATSGTDIVHWLQAMNQQAVKDSNLNHEIWAAKEFAVGGPRPLERSILDLEERLVLFEYPESLHDIAQWFHVAAPLMLMLRRRGTRDDTSRIMKLCNVAQQLTNHALFGLNQAEWDAAWRIKLIREFAANRSFEAFAALIQKVRTILSMSMTQSEVALWFQAATPFCLSAYHFCVASDLHSGIRERKEDYMAQIRELDTCIRIYPVEATFYFFKGLWLQGVALGLIDASDAERGSLLVEAEELFRTASQKEPTWVEPVNRLANLMSRR